MRQITKKLTTVALLLPLITACLGKMERITEATREQVQDSNEKLADMQKGTQVIEAIGQLSLGSDNLRAAAVQRLIKLLEDEDRLAEYFAMPAPIYLPSLYMSSSRSDALPVDAKSAETQVPNIVLIERQNSRPQEPNTDQNLGPADWLMVNTMSRDLYHTVFRTFSKFFARYDDAAQIGALSSEKKQEICDLAPRVLRLATAVFGAAYVDDFFDYVEHRAVAIERYLRREDRLKMASNMFKFIRLFDLDDDLQVEAKQLISERMQLDPAELESAQHTL